MKADIPVGNGAKVLVSVARQAMKIRIYTSSGIHFRSPGRWHRAPTRDEPQFVVAHRPDRVHMDINVADDFWAARIR